MNTIKKSLILALTVLSSAFVYADTIPANIGIFEHLDEYIPKGLQFTNQEGQQVSLDTLIDKPTILVLVYYNCPGICSPLLDGVTDLVDESDLVAGVDYQIVTISFNWDEDWELARDKRKNYLSQLEREIDPNAWQWMVGDSASVMKLVDAVGFGFKKEDEDYVHAAPLMMLSPDGKITRYLYGLFFNPWDVKMAVIEASKGQSRPTINKVLDYCFSYDAEGKKYVFNITKIAATVILLTALSLFLYLVFTRKKKITRHN